MSEPDNAADPKGHRLARKRALLLAEARVLCDALNVLLRRAGVELDDSDSIARQLLA